MNTYNTPAVDPNDHFDPDLDLVLERVIDVPRQAVWDAWTIPEQITKWFTPTPWTTPFAELDLRPGGAFRTIMRGPEGEEHDNTGCYLDVVVGERLVWTSALGPGFRPSAEPQPVHFTAFLSLSDVENGTRYRVVARHTSSNAAKAHEEMGFTVGWGLALDQLLAMVNG